MSIPLLTAEIRPAGNVLRLTFNMEVDATLTDPTGLTLSSGAVDPVITGGVGSIGVTQLDLPLSRTVYSEETPTISWNPESGESIVDHDSSGDELDVFTDAAVTNGSTVNQPSIDIGWTSLNRRLEWTAPNRRMEFTAT